MRRLAVILIVISIILILSGGDLLAADFGIFDDYQFMAGPLYTRPVMPEFTGYFQEVYGAMVDENQVLGELLAAFDDEDIEDAGFTEYSFNHHTNYPSAPIDSFGFYLNLINTTEFGYRALLNYDLIRLDFSARGNNSLSLKLDEEDLDNYNQAELFYENRRKTDVQILIHSLGAEYHFPFFAEIGNQLPELFEFFSLNVGGAYYWGSGRMAASEYRLERLVGEDSDGEEVDQKYEISEIQNYDLTLVGSPGYKVGVGFDYPIKQGMMVSAGVNYRALELDLEASRNDNEFLNNLTEDFSGLEMKLGLFYQF
ncbi:MAG: hypothetical protein ABR596_09470 [Halarsenatibacteraceae bacterium]